MYTLFHCSKHSKNDLHSEMPAIRTGLNIIFHENLVENKKKELFCKIDGRLYQTNLMLFEGNVLFNIARKQLKKAEETALGENGIYSVNVADIRDQIITLLSVCCWSAKECSDSLQKDLLKYVKMLKSSVSPLNNLDQHTVLKLTSESVRDDQLAIHHYFHMYLEIQWLTLCIYYKCNASLEVYTAIFKEFIILSRFLYIKEDKCDLLRKNAYVCQCVKQFWILLQIFNEQLFKAGVLTKCFWETFNGILEPEDDLFSLWLLNNFAALQGYNEKGIFMDSTNELICANHNFLELKLKSLNNRWSSINSDNNKILINCCDLVEPLLNYWWKKTKKVEPIQLLWEMFYKHINVPLGIKRDVDSAIAIIESVDSILYYSKRDDAYKYFLYILNKHLTELPNHWPKIRGRIYCKLSPQKINDFSDTGLLNVTLLFLSLANNVNINEISQKLLWLLSNLTEERRMSPRILTIFASIILLFVRRDLLVTEVSIPLVELIQNISCRRELFYLVRLYVECLDVILSVSRNFCLGQKQLLGSWIEKYMKVCHYNDLCYLLNVLISNIERIRTTGVWSEWEGVFKQHVLSNLKSLATSESSPPQVGQLAALIDVNTSSELVLTFTADSIAPKVTCHFVQTLLERVSENYSPPKSCETAILHVWVRCCLLKCENNEQLTRNIPKLMTISLIINQPQILNENPLCSFIKAISKSSLKHVNLCEQCFGRLDIWIVSYLKNPPNEAIVVHIYTCIALLIFQCAPLLYNKTRSNCLLSRLINTFLLSTDILMGKSPHPYVLNAIQRTWHLFVQGIFSLDCFGDAFLERTLRDLVVRYIILLPVNDFPILKCISQQQLMAFLLEKIAATFLSRSSKSTETNTTKALKIVELVLRSGNFSNINEIILQTIMTAVLEVVMFHAPKGVAIDIVKFVSSPNQPKEFKNYLKQSLKTVTEKHLAFNTANYFQFTNTLVKVIPREMRAVLPDIRSHIAEVERMRGVGFDSTLRQGLDRLIKLLE